MTISELHGNEEIRRKLFPVSSNGPFLANAAVCALPACSAQAMTDYSWQATQGDQEFRFPLEIQTQTRDMSAELLGCTRDDIALVAPTSVGLSLIANGFPFKAGDNVIYSPDDYPSNVVVWQNLEKKGVELRPIIPTETGKITLEDVRKLTDERTRLVALVSVHFIGGYRLDINAIGAFLQERGIYFSVDGIQSVGALDTPIEYVDFLPADAHKWMLGPCAAGILYVSERGREILEPILLGWHNVVCPDFITPNELTFLKDARRYEAGSPNMVGIMGMHASLNMLKQYGFREIEETVLNHTRHIREEVRKRGYELACNDDQRISGITSFRREGEDMEALHKRLAEAGVTASCRKTRDGRSWIRLSPHFYNTGSEIDHALSVL